MAITNYGELKTAVAELMHSSDLDSQMDNAVLVARSTISDQLDSWVTTNFDVLDVADRQDPDGPEYTLPSDFVAMKEIYHGDVVFAGGIVTGKDIFGVTTFERNSQLRELRAGGSMPVNSYSIDEVLSTIRFAVNPPEGTEFVIYYIAAPAHLVDDADTNGLLLVKPYLYVYAMCKYLSIFTQDIEMSQVFAQSFQELIDLANEQQRRGINEGPIQIAGASAWV